MAGPGADSSTTPEPPGRTLWTHAVAVPLRAFVRTESGSAAVLVAAIVVALGWSNVDPGSYQAVWHAPLAIRLGGMEIAQDLRGWIDSGLMTLFFLVVGLEARREFDMGDLRDRRRFVLPCCAGVVGLLIPIGCYLLINLGGPGQHGWGAAMSTDTALALGLMAMLGRNVPGRVRVFLVTVFVVDDLLSLLVIAVAYRTHLAVLPLGIALVAFALVIAGRAAGIRPGSVYAGLGLVMWVALLASGVDPVVTGLAIGLTTSAYPPARGDLERATGLFRLFREQPTPELARTATSGLTASLSPNARLQSLYHPWTSYLIVPLFGLSNAGITIDGGFLARAYTAPVTLGVLIGYVVGKPIGVAGTSWLLTRVSGGRIRPNVGWAAVLATGTIAGIGFTVSLLIATIAFQGTLLDDAKLGVLSAALVSSLLTWLIYRITAALPKHTKALLLLGRAEQLIDLLDDVDPPYDHIRGPAGASVTIVEYGDFECPYCGRAEPVVRELLTDSDVRYVWRHLPLTDVHPNAQLAAEAAEAATAQGAFWPMHDLLLTRQDNLRFKDLLRYAGELGLDTDRFGDELSRHVHTGRVARDVESADLSGVAGTPTLFVNGQRYHGRFDIQALTDAVRIARARVAIEARAAG